MTGRLTGPGGTSAPAGTGASSGHGGVSPATKAARHDKIAAILSRSATPVRSQEELAERLAQLGIRVTQATLSRDLDELGAVRLRGPDGSLVYALPHDPADALIDGDETALPLTGLAAAAAGGPARAAGATGPPWATGPAWAAAGSTSALARVAADLLLSAEASGNLVVIRTPPGAAQLMASMIDRTGLPAVLGTVAGDDTVLVVSRDPAGGDDLAAMLLRLAERRVRTASAEPAIGPGVPDSGTQAVPAHTVRARGAHSQSTGTQTKEEM